MVDTLTNMRNDFIHTMKIIHREPSSKQEKQLTLEGFARPNTGNGIIILGNRTGQGYDDDFADNFGREK